MNVQTNYCNNLLVLDVKQLNKIMNFYHFHTLKALSMARVKLRNIMGCPGLKSSYREKGLFLLHAILSELTKGSADLRMRLLLKYIFIFIELFVVFPLFLPIPP